MGCAYKTEKRDLENCKLGREEKGSFPSLEALDLLWDKSKAITVHFPVRALHFLSQEQNLFGFKHIVPDDSFFKPMGMNDDSVNEIVGCFRHTKNQDLLYVARYREYKGQLKFIKQADPALLTNYTIHFYGSGGLDAMNYMKEIDMMGHSRGIKVAVHHHVSKQTLLQHSCHAAGQILWPSQDSNPRAGELISCIGYEDQLRGFSWPPDESFCRMILGMCAAYEGLYAGMPLFISTTAGVPKPLLEQPFVQAVPFNASVDDFNASLGVWMDIVASHRTSTSSRRRIIGYTKTALDPENVYWELCERIGICAARPEVAVDDALEESTGRDASSVQQKDPQREI